MKRLMMALLLCMALVPAMAQDEQGTILVFKTDGVTDTLLLNNVRDIYHSRLDANGVEQPDISTLRLRLVGGERVYPIQEVDHVVMPKCGRLISFMGTAQSNTNAAAGRLPWKTSVHGNFPGSPGDAVVYKWTRRGYGGSGDRIFLPSGDRSDVVQGDYNLANGYFHFQSDTLMADQYVIYYPGEKEYNDYNFNTVTIPTTQTQTGATSSDHLGLSGDCGTAIAYRRANSVYEFALDHKTGVVCFLPRVDKLNTIQLKSVAVKAGNDKKIAGTYTLSPEGVALVAGTGSDSITLVTSNFQLPHQAETAQDTLVAYMVMAPQVDATPLTVYYRLHDTKSEIDTTVIKNISLTNGIQGGYVYPVTSNIDVHSFFAAFTDSAKWAFGEKARLYGSVNLPNNNVGIIWGFNKNLNFTNAEQDIALTPDGELSFNGLTNADVKQKAYYYRAYAKENVGEENEETYFGKVKKFGMEREAINMGTSVKWSNINMGAITEEDLGNYYAWGELSTKDSYTQANYAYYDTDTRANTSIGSDISGDPRYDVVAATWRGCWRMPTSVELNELRSKCTWTSETITNEDEQTTRTGYRVVNKTNADSTIFIPFAGYYEGTTLKNSGSGYNWSATENNNTYSYYQHTSYSSVQYASKFLGMTIRPVFESNYETPQGQFLFVRTDPVVSSDTDNSKELYGTMRGLDEDVTVITQGFVIGTTADVTLDSSSGLLKSYSRTAPDNGGYKFDVSNEDMDEIVSAGGSAEQFYVRAFIILGENSYYGDPVTMASMTVTTDSTNWQVGMTKARLCATTANITESVKSSLQIGFIIGHTPDIDIDNNSQIILCDSIVSGKFVCEIDNIEEKQYYYRAFIRQNNGHVIYASVDAANNIYGTKMFGLEFVDLGLPSGLRWANINVGSQAPYDNGSFYAWGETQPRTNQTDGNYILRNMNLGDDIGGTLYDAAQVNWQGPWRMASKTEYEELIANCTLSEATLYGKSCYLFTSKNNGKQIYLPRTGYYNNNNHKEPTWRLITWTSTAIPGKETTEAWVYDNYKSNGQPALSDVKLTNCSRWYGFTVRPVAMVNDTLQDQSKVYMTTDSVQWEVGQTTARLYGYVLGLRYDSLATETGFVYYTDSRTRLTNGETVLPQGVQYLNTSEGEVALVASGVFHCDVPDIQDNIIYYYRAYCKVDGKFYYANEREFGRRIVDLGLPSGLLWSNLDLGQSSPDNRGDYYAWGETAPRNNFTTSNYTKLDLGKDISGSSHDAAHVNWGGIWRMPTDNDIRELLEQCTWTEVVKYDQPMYKVVGPSGDSIFIAKMGHMNGTSLSGNGTRVSMWTSNLDVTQGYGNDNAYGADFNGNSRTITAVSRYMGYVIRPVAKYNYTLYDDTRVYATTDSTNWQVGVAEPRLYGAVAIENREGGMTRNDLTTGFIVGFNPNNLTVDAAINDENIKNVAAAFVGDEIIFSGVTEYAKDTTYYYRAYVKVGSDTYYGEVKRFGLELIDLGYGVKWASINMGAQTSSDYGNRYAWGETNANKSSYTIDTYKHYINAYEDIGNDISNTSNDVAKIKWGGTWRMPSIQDMKVLVDSCQWQWTNQDGQPGYLVTSRKTGFTDKSIFLPAAGYQDGTYYQMINSDTYYWTSSLYNASDAYILHGTSAEAATDAMTRFYGLFVRPVTTAGIQEGGGGDITGGHNQGESQQTSGETSGNGNAGTGNTGGVVH